jgi:hypothetical protein
MRTGIEEKREQKHKIKGENSRRHTIHRPHTKLYWNYITTYLDLTMGTAMAMAITAQIRRKRKKHMILFLRAARA